MYDSVNCVPLPSQLICACWACGRRGFLEAGGAAPAAEGADASAVPNPATIPVPMDDTDIDDLLQSITGEGLVGEAAKEERGKRVAAALERLVVKQARCG